MTLNPSMHSSLLTLTQTHKWTYKQAQNHEAMKTGLVHRDPQS